MEAALGRKGSEPVSLFEAALVCEDDLEATLGSCGGRFSRPALEGFPSLGEQFPASPLLDIRYSLSETDSCLRTFSVILSKNDQDDYREKSKVWSKLFRVLKETLINLCYAKAL